MKGNETEDSASRVGEREATIREEQKRGLAKLGYAVCARVGGMDRVVTW